jgi:hypothetical protein
VGGTHVFGEDERGVPGPGAPTGPADEGGRGRRRGGGKPIAPRTRSRRGALRLR